jgi:glucokinase
VTVGSGIGVVLVVDGQIVRVMHGVTGDAAHIIVIAASKETCPIGCHGCLETVASARAIAHAGRHVVETGNSPDLARRLHLSGDLSSKDVAEAAAAGDSAALAVLRQAGHWLGIGLASWAPVYEPDVVLIGGGVSQAGHEWLAAAEAGLRAHGCPFFTRKIRLRPATLGNSAGMIGAGLAALSAIQRFRPSARGSGGRL